MREPLYPPEPIYPSEPPPRRRKRRKSLLLSFLGFGFAAAVVVFICASAAAGYMLWKTSQDLPDYESLAKYEPPVMTRIHAHNGALIAEYARERRIFVPINTIPKRVIAAFLSAEDRRFYEHGGVDFQGIARAVYKVVEGKIRGSDKRAEGGSTITQQVAKNFLLSSERSMERKLKEAILAIRIERAYSKDKILELYLNEIYFRHRRLRHCRREPQLLQQGAAGSDGRGGRVSGRAPEGPQQLPSIPAREAGADPARLDHRPDA